MTYPVQAAITWATTASPDFAELVRGATGWQHFSTHSQALHRTGIDLFFVLKAPRSPGRQHELQSWANEPADIRQYDARLVADSVLAGVLP